MSGDELRTLLDSGPLNADDLKHLGDQDVTQVKQGASNMICTDHGVALETYHYMYNSPLVIHTCPTDGSLWVAAGEIEQMEQWRAKADGPPSAQESAVEDATAIIGQEIAATQRWQNFGTFMGVLSRWSPGWVGLL